MVSINLLNVSVDKIEYVSLSLACSAHNSWIVVVMFMVKHNGESVDAWLIKFLFGLSLVSTVHVLLLLFIFQAAQTVSHALSSTDNSEYIGKV